METSMFFGIIVICLHGYIYRFPIESDSRYNVNTSTVDNCDLPKFELEYRAVTAASYDWCPEQKQQRRMLGELIEFMKLYLVAHKKAGLIAANFGVNRRIMIIVEELEVLINPVIKKEDESQETKQCYFFHPNGTTYGIKMHSQIKVSFIDVTYLPKKKIYSGQSACVVQYNMRLLDGKGLARA